jgi:hypothetical protein
MVINRTAKEPGRRGRKSITPLATLSTGRAKCAIVVTMRAKG